MARCSNWALRALLCLVVVSVAFAESDDDDSPRLVELTEENFVSTLDENANVFVTFYHSRKNMHLGLDAVAAVEQAMEEEPSIVDLALYASLDCYEAPKICEDFEVSRFPHLRMFSEGVGMYEYDRPALATRVLVPFIVQHTAQKIFEVNSAAELEEMSKKNRVLLVVGALDTEDAVVGSVKRAGGELFHFLKTVIVHLEESDVDAFAQLTGEQPGEVFLAREASRGGHRLHTIPYEGEKVTRKRLVTWTKLNFPADVYDLRHEQARMIALNLLSDLPMAEVFVDANDEQRWNAVKSFLMPIAELYRRKMVISVVDRNRLTADRAHRLGLTGDECVSISHGGKYALNADQLEAKSVSDFVQEVLDRKAKVVVVTEAVPEEPMENGVYKLVKSTYREVVFDEEKDVVVFFMLSPDMCQPCVDLLPVFEELAAAYAHHPEIRFAKVDMYKNVGMPTPKISNFPSVRMFSTDGKYNYEIYRGKFDVDSLTMWVNDVGSFEYKPRSAATLATAAHDEEPEEVPVDIE